MTPDELPIRSHRRDLLPDTRQGRLMRRIVAAVLIIAALAIGSAITSHTPDTDDAQRAFVRTGVLGSAVDVRTFDVTVLGVRGAAQITQDDTAHDTSGVWIIVRLRLTARTNPTVVSYAVLRDAQGRTYRATGRIDQSLLDGRPLEPGVPVTVELAFEVPTSVATGLSIQLAESEGDQRMDALARIRIPVTAAQVGQWRSDKTAATVAAPALSG
jgi:hypothetical protein